MKQAPYDPAQPCPHVRAWDGERIVNLYPKSRNIVLECGRCYSLPRSGQAKKLNHLPRPDMMEEVGVDAPDLLVRRFEAQAECTPDAIAVEDGANLVTYRDLNHHANLLANRLIAAGAAPEVRIGLYMEGGADLITAMLAVWKAGAAYVPFDSNLPPQRLANLCRAGGLFLVLTSQSVQSRLAGLNVRFISVDDISPGYGAANPRISVSARNLAYLIFTSGTTGVAKAVGVEHASLGKMISWANDALRPTASDRSAQVVALGFDAIFLELWPYLLAGGTICFPRRADRQSAEQLQKWLLHQRISVVLAPTPLGEALLTLHWPQDAALRVMIVGGDRLRRYPDSTHPFQLLNVYGPTENTVASTAAIVPPIECANLPSIGHPISGQSAIILDEKLMPVPAGCIGELYLIGHGLARGYHGDPAMTAARFVACNHSPVPGARMLRSGDFARTLPNGEIEFVGRQDRQIKILGHRIDLAEIESSLLHCPNVSDVAIVTNELPDGQLYLTAYVVSHIRTELPPATNSALVASLREFAGARLPSYMCPSAYHVVPALPMTENGKIDVRSLQKSVMDELDLKTLSADEQLLALAFRDLLGVSSVGPASDFFACGGHSLLTARLVQHIRRDFGVNITIGEIYQNPRLSQLARLIEEHREVGQLHADSLPSSVIPMQISGASPAFFCVAPAGGSPLCYRKLARYLAEDRLFYGLQSQGLGDNLPPLTSVEAIAAAHVTALRQAQPIGPYYLGGWSFGAIVAWEMAVQLTEQGQLVAQLALLDGWAERQGGARRGMHFLETGAIAAMGFRFLRQITWPRSYDEVRELAQWVGIGLPNSLAHLKRATWKERAAAISKMMQEAYRSILIFQANARAALRYRPRPYLGNCVLYRTKSAGTNAPADRVVGEIRELTGGAFEVVALDATHMSLMMQDDHIAELAAALAKQLRTVQTKTLEAVAA